MLAGDVISLGYYYTYITMHILCEGVEPMDGKGEPWVWACFIEQIEQKFQQL